MAERGRTVRVSGLPTDIEDSKLKDKLQIHFLRPKNGGGEVESVSIVKAVSVSALIAFEESEVAQRVVQQSRHILEVDGKKHTLTVTEHYESPDPDKVILSLAATVKYSQLPGGLQALTSLHESHPDVQINSETEESCTLCGTYAKVQAALTHLLGHSGGPLPADIDSGQSDPTDCRSVQMAKMSHIQGSGNHSRKPHKQREQGLSYEYNTSTHNDLAPCAHGSEDIGQAVGADLQHLGHSATSEEDFLLILDADMFQYLQKNCSKEYQFILSHYGVDVVDMTSQGLTTLFLQIKKAGRKSGQQQQQQQQNLEMARKAISRLYQENETRIRRDQLPKSLLSSSGGLQKVVQNLKVQLPKLLLNEDDKYIYIIGSSSDVSEAKQILLHKQDKVTARKDNVASLLRYSTYDSSLADDVRVSSIEGCLSASEEDQRSVERARKCKLAPQFKDSGLATLGNQPTDFTLRGRLSSSRQTHTGPMLGHDVLSEAAGISGERSTRTEPQSTGEDGLFRSGDTLNSVLQNKTSLHSNVINTQPRNLTSPLSTTHSHLLEHNVLPAAESAPTLKRASSFSGTPQQKAKDSQKSLDDSSKSIIRARGRSSSFTTQTDNPDVYNEVIKTSMIMWQHIKKAYSTRVDSLTSDVQIKEIHPKGSGDLTITVSGTDIIKVNSCQMGLQKLVDLVSIDFSVQELRLSDLGITDTADETLQSCCTEVRSRYKKVTLLFSKNSLYLLGPIHLCSKVATTLREVFSGESTQTPQHQDFHSPPASNGNASASLKRSEEQSSILHCISNSRVMLESQMDKAEATGGKEKGETNHNHNFWETEIVNGPVNQPSVRKDPVIKEKVKNLGSMQMDGQKTDTHVNISTAANHGNLRHVNGATAHTDKALPLHKKEKSTHATEKDSMQERLGEIQDPPMESMSGQRDKGFICVCGDNGASVMRTKCGVTMCTNCLAAVHVHCRVCHEKDPILQGIKGNMSHAMLHISLPGHSKDSVIKITYCIPDGIQGRDHPSPGNPFQGGTFEAFLPDCERARKLLPRLEKSFRQGLTFTVTSKDTGAQVTWNCIPHKTSLYGGKSGSGYPDSTYLNRLSQVLNTHGIE